VATADWIKMQFGVVGQGKMYQMEVQIPHRKGNFFVGELGGVTYTENAALAVQK